MTSAITRSARGEDCTVRIIGVCTHDPETVIWSHCRWGQAVAASQSLERRDVIGLKLRTTTGQQL